MNCDIWMTVDFGRGPVDVRCTETGEHNTHRCLVEILPFKQPELPVMDSDSTRHNIFETGPRHAD